MIAAMSQTVLAAFPSPSRGVWHLGPIPIRAYALCIIVGIIAALIIGDRRWAARGGERGVIYDIAVWAVPGGLLGGRLYHLITDWQTYFGPTGAGIGAALRIWDGGLGIWGAVALGGVGAWIGCRRRGIPLPAFADAVAPGIVLAQAIGRLGNYFNQELYGRETTLPWGMEIFWRRDPSGIESVHSLDGVSTGQVFAVVQPTFLYELLWNVLVFVALIYLDRRFKFGHGRLFALYVAAYCVGRFGIELLRSDPATLIDGIRVNSFTSTFVFIGAVVYMVLAPKEREDPAVLRATWATEEAVEEPEAKTAVDAAAADRADVVSAAVGAEDLGEDESEAHDEDVAEDAEAPAELEDEAPAEAEAEAEEVVADEAAGDGEPGADAEADEPDAEDLADAEDVGEGESAEVESEVAEPVEADEGESEAHDVDVAEDAELEEEAPAAADADADAEAEAEAEEVVADEAAGDDEPEADDEADEPDAEDLADAEDVGEAESAEAEPVEADEGESETQDVDVVEEADAPAELEEEAEPDAVAADEAAGDDEPEADDEADEPDAEDLADAEDVGEAESAEAEPVEADEGESEAQDADVVEEADAPAELEEEAEPDAVVADEAAGDGEPEANAEADEAEAAADSDDAPPTTEVPQRRGRWWMRASRR